MTAGAPARRPTPTNTLTPTPRFIARFIAHLCVSQSIEIGTPIASRCGLAHAKALAEVMRLRAVHMTISEIGAANACARKRSTG
jgi:hypothetical protein